MSTIVTRYGKGSPLTWLEVDNNFTNLNTDKIQSGDTVAALTITSATINGGTITGITDLAVADGGTGLSSLTAGYIPFGAGTSAFGSSANLFWDNTNSRLGIGTASPSNNLSINCGAGDGILINATTGQANIFLQQAGSTNGTINAAGGAGTDLSITGNRTLRLFSGTVGGTAGIVFNTFGSERMRIDSTGNVGIGTTSPTTLLSFPATVGTAGDANRISLYTSGTDIYGFGISSGQLNIRAGDSGNIVFFTSTAGTATERMRITSAGNVGIGVTNPGSYGKLEISGAGYVGTSLVSTDASGVRVVLAANSSTEARLNVVSNSPLAIFTNSTERMRIDTSGNVGIGTTSVNVQTRLAIAYTNRITDARGIVSINSTDAAAANLGGSLSLGGQTGQATAEYVFGSVAGRYEGSGYSGYLQLATTKSDGTVLERMRIHASGGVSIGNTTDSGAASLNVSGSMSGGYIAHADGTTAMAFGADNVVRVTPNATATYTSTVPAAGAICVLSILTSGTTSYTITFGTGFKSTGTLATGTVSARYFNITFVSDGTNLIETSRTVAIA